MNKSKYIIFDMDGVLVDSEPMHKEIIEKALSLLNIEFTPSYLFTLTGMSDRPMWSKIKSDFKLTYTVEDLIKHHKAIFQEEFPHKQVHAVKGVVPLIENLKADGWHISVASSSSHKLIKHFTNAIGVAPFLDFWVSGNDFKESKPNPDIFLSVANKYGVATNHFWVVEDSFLGVTAAKRANMKCIGFQNPNSQHQDLSQADYIIHHIYEVFDIINLAL